MSVKNVIKIVTSWWPWHMWICTHLFIWTEWEKL